MISTHRRFIGTVVSAKMQKTVVAEVERTVTHPKYHKHYTQTKRFPIHDETGACKVGDVIEFEETRPLSRTKRWRFVRKVSDTTTA